MTDSTLLRTHPSARTALRQARLLVSCYLGLSAATVVVVVVLRNHHDMVNDAVWVRTVIVLVTAGLMALFAARTLAGSARAWLRWRVVSAVMVVAIAVIVALPDSFPAWLKVEQVVCGLLLLGVVALVNSRPVRAAFAR